MDRNRERKHLGQANRQIAQLKGQISRQLQVVQRLQQKGKLREEAKANLAMLEDSLRIVEQQRDLILERLQDAN